MPTRPRLTSSQESSFSRSVLGCREWRRNSSVAWTVTEGPSRDETNASRARLSRRTGSALRSLDRLLRDWALLPHPKRTVLDSGWLGYFRKQYAALGIESHTNAVTLRIRSLGRER